MVPPLHHRIVTAKLTGRRATKHRSRPPRRSSSARSPQIEDGREPTPAGIGVTAAWGLPYFDRFVPDEAAAHMPVDRARDPRQAARDQGADPFDPLPERPARRRPRGERRRLAAAERRQRRGPRRSQATAWRPATFSSHERPQGFAGGGFDGRHEPAEADGARGRHSGRRPRSPTPPSCSSASPRRRKPASARRGSRTSRRSDTRTRRADTSTAARTSPLAPLRGPGGVVPDLRLPRPGRHDVRPGMKAKPGAQTLGRGRDEVATVAQGQARLRDRPDDRAQRFAPDGVSPRRGHAWTATARSTRRARRSRTAPTSTRSTTRSPGAPTRTRDRIADAPAAGVHFVVFNPTSDDFRRDRLAMDGVLPDGDAAPFPRGARGQGFNSVLQPTHRQNFLVPPRAHRSFPLVELLA